MPPRPRRALLDGSASNGTPARTASIGDRAPKRRRAVARDDHRLRAPAEYPSARTRRAGAVIDKLGHGGRRRRIRRHQRFAELDIQLYRARASGSGSPQPRS